MVGRVGACNGASKAYRWTAAHLGEGTHREQRIRRASCSSVIFHPTTRAGPQAQSLCTCRITEGRQRLGTESAALRLQIHRGAITPIHVEGHGRVIADDLPSSTYPLNAHGRAVPQIL